MCNHTSSPCFASDGELMSSLDNLAVAFCASDNALSI